MVLNSSLQLLLIIDPEYRLLCILLFPESNKFVILVLKEISKFLFVNWKHDLLAYETIKVKKNKELCYSQHVSSCLLLKYWLTVSQMYTCIYMCVYICEISSYLMFTYLHKLGCVFCFFFPQVQTVLQKG